MPTDPGDGDDADSGDQPVCGSTDTTDGSPCQFPVPADDPDSHCYLHDDDGDGPPDGHGSGDPGHSKGGNPDAPGAPAGNKRAMTHGVYASKNDPWGTLDHLQDDQPQVYAQVVRWFWNEAQAAPFAVYVDGEMPGLPADPTDPDADGIPGIDVSRLTARGADLLLVSLDRGVIYNATMEQAKRGLATTQKRKNSDGDYVDVVDENPVNMPKNRTRREDRAQLKDLGLRDDSPDAVAAQGQQDLAAAAERVARRKEQPGSRNDDGDADQDDGDGDGGSGD
jgi:hypothetical protein